MAVSTTLLRGDVEALKLDPMNPRLGRHRMSPDTPQDQLLEWMGEWKLEELALSYLGSGGFWSHEPLIVVKELLYKKKALVVVEGNRRLAALICLKNTLNGDPPSKKWSEMLNGETIPPKLLTDVPYVLADSREDVQAFLGFRHVTGIKQWDADEKAGFIVQLVDGSNLTYDQVARKIGSTTPTVRRHYIAYQLLLQMESTIDDFPIERAERRFAVLYDAIQKHGAQEYLGLSVTAAPDAAKSPIKKKRLSNLAHFSRWLYGTKTIEPLVRDTRQISDFGTILESVRAIEYLENTEQPKFEIAFQLAGGDEPELIRLLSTACDQIEESLRTIHLHKSSQPLQKVVHRLGADATQLLATFPAIRKRLEEGDRK